jgi:hypothetical protein
VTDTTKDTLATLERLIVRDAVSPHAALQAAYQLGKLDGGMEMAQIGERAVEEFIEVHREIRP